jgi:hypothetical protein
VVEQLRLEELGLFDPPSGAAEGMAVDGSRVYLAATSAGVYVLDTSDPSAPAQLGQYDFPTGQLAYRVAVDGSRLAVGLRGSGWALLDVSDPDEIVLLASDDGADAADVALRGDTLYYLNANGPSSVDVSDVENLPVRLRLERHVQTLVLEVAELVSHRQRRHVGQLDETELELVLLERERLGLCAASRNRREQRENRGCVSHPCAPKKKPL